MSGFDSFRTTDELESALGADASRTHLSREGIQRHVARAHRLRADELHQWGRRVARTWASLFRRPGRLIPDSMRAGEPLQPAPQG
jgi:hypothetical protein